MKTYLGIDGCPSGWLVIKYQKDEFDGAYVFSDIQALWKHFSDVELGLIDIPIGLPESGRRKCDIHAKDHLNKRSRSIFYTPVRKAVEAHQKGYEQVKKIQEKNSNNSLSKQAFNICDKIHEVDSFLDNSSFSVVSKLQESHPELCFKYLNEGNDMTHSKTGNPGPALWERVNVLEAIKSDFMEDLKSASNDLLNQVNESQEFENHDLIDAFVLSLTACPVTSELKSIPAKPEEPQGDPETDLTMKIKFASQSQT